MIYFAKYTLHTALFLLLSCKGGNGYTLFYDCTTSSGINNYNTVISQKIVLENDSIKVFDNYGEKHILTYETSNGVYQSKDGITFNMSYSFQDSLKYSNFISPFDTLYNISLLGSRIYNIKNSRIVVYKYVEELPDQSEGYISYYIPKIGVVLYYWGGLTERVYTRRFSKMAKVDSSIINRIKSDTTFYAAFLLKNPTVKAIKELPPEN
tara:strand:+ start:314 stop:940 length:627 start_codon:yes stop_codon:yes gene_type:complete